MSYDPKKYGPAGNPPDRPWSTLANFQPEKVLHNRKRSIDKGDYPYKYTLSWIATELNTKILSESKKVSAAGFTSSAEYNSFIKYPFKPEEVEWHCFLEKVIYAQLLGAQIRGTRLEVDSSGKPESSWWPPLEKVAFQEAILEAWEVAKMTFSKEVEDLEGASRIIATEKFMAICKDFMVLKAADTCLSWERNYF